METKFRPLTLTWLAAILILALTIMPNFGGGMVKAAPDVDMRDMRSALQYLQDMDNYYGEISRPR